METDMQSKMHNLVDHQEPNSTNSGANISKLEEDVQALMKAVYREGDETGPSASDLVLPAKIVTKTEPNI
jgi:hypothetical protein